MAMIRALLMTATALFYSTLSTATTVTSCSKDQVEAVELITRHESWMETPMIGGVRMEQKRYFNAKGELYSHQTGERQIPTGILESGGFAFRWAPLEKESWETGGRIYRSSKGEKGEHHKLSHATERDHNSLVAIEEIPQTENTELKAGFRCRLSMQKLADGPETSVCNLRIYGRNTPIDADIVHANGAKQTTRILSLTTTCVDKTLFDVPKRDWK